MSKTGIPVTYKLTEDGNIQRSDGAFIPCDMGNRDYMEYMEWCNAGHSPDPVRTPEEEAQKIVDDEVNELRGDLQRVVKGQFQMMLEMFKLIKQFTDCTNSDVDPDIMAKAQQWTTKLNRLKELGDN